jgi:glutathione S-transferase
MSAITLFGSRLSPFVEKVARALQLKGLVFQTVDIRLPGDLKRWNPTTRKMPVIEIDGEKTWDSTFILQRLDELQPEPPLFSEDPSVAASQRMLEDWCDESLYWHLMALRWCERNAAATAEQLAGTAPAALRPLAKPLLRRQIGAMPKVQGFGRLPYDVLARETAQRLDDLVLLLGARPFFFSDRVSAADLALFGELAFGSSGASPDFADLLSDRASLVEHMKRVEDATRP